MITNGNNPFSRRSREALAIGSVLMALGLTACSGQAGHEDSTQTHATVAEASNGASAGLVNGENSNGTGEIAAPPSLEVAMQIYERGLKIERQKFIALGIPKQEITGYKAPTADIDQMKKVKYYPWKDHLVGGKLSLDPKSYTKPYTIKGNNRKTGALPLNLDDDPEEDAVYGNLGKKPGGRDFDGNGLIIGHTDSKSKKGGIMDHHIDTENGDRQVIRLEDGTKLVAEVVIKNTPAKGDGNNAGLFTAEDLTVISCVLREVDGELVYDPTVSVTTGAKIVMVITSDGHKFDLRELWPDEY